MSENLSVIETTACVPVVVEDVSNLPAVQTDYSALVEKWIDFTKKHSGLRSYYNAVKQALNYFNEHGITILAATDDDIYSWLEYLKAEKSPSTVQMYLVAVRLFFAFLHKQEIIADNPCEGMKAGVKIDRDKHNRDYLSVKRAQDLIAKMPAETEMQLRNRAIVRKPCMKTCAPPEIPKCFTFKAKVTPRKMIM